MHLSVQCRFILKWKPHEIWLAVLTHYKLLGGNQSNRFHENMTISVCNVACIWLRTMVDKTASASPLQIWWVLKAVNYDWAYGNDVCCFGTHFFRFSPPNYVAFILCDYVSLFKLLCGKKTIAHAFLRSDTDTKTNSATFPPHWKCCNAAGKCSGRDWLAYLLTNNTTDNRVDICLALALVVQSVFFVFFSVQTKHTRQTFHLLVQ